MGLCVACVVGWLFYGLGSFPGLNGDEADQALAWGTSADGWPFWRMLFRDSPSGRYPHFLLVTMMRACQEIWGPGLLAVRLPNVLLGLLALLSLWWWMRRCRPEDPWFPWPFVLLLACHPMFLGYARFGWEPGAAWVGLVWVCAPFFSSWDGRSRRFLGCSLALGSVLLLLAHPLYVALLGILGYLCFGVWASEKKGRWRSGWWLLTAALLCGVCARLWWMSGILGHPFDFWRWTRAYPGTVAEIVSGVRIFQFLIGVSWSPWYVLFLVMAGAWSLWSGVVLYRHNGKLLFRGLALVVLCLLVCFLFWPHYPATRGNSRYMLFAVAPVVLLWGFGASQLPQKWGKGLVLGAVALSLVGFYQSYFVAGWSRDNLKASAAFWSGSDASDDEPKVKAARWIQQFLRPDARVFVGSFWMEKPLAYLLQRKIEYFWSRKKPDAGLLFRVDWRKESWVLVDFNKHSSRLRGFLGALKRRGVSFRIQPIRSRRGTAQIFLAFPLHAVRTTPEKGAR